VFNQPDPLPRSTEELHAEWLRELYEPFRFSAAIRRWRSRRGAGDTAVVERPKARSQPGALPTS
jgi:hypothetical protein